MAGAIANTVTTTTVSTGKWSDSPVRASMNASVAAPHPKLSTIRTVM
jgi:hypothetical protein